MPTLINPPKLEWFGGNEDAAQMMVDFAYLLHAWDDLVDKDVVVTEQEINNAFLIALVALPQNKFYRSIMDDVAPMWVSIIHAYKVANQYERDKDDKGLEIGHNLRYAVGHIISYAVDKCIGKEAAEKVLPEIWKQIVFDDLEEYKKEHKNVKPN